MNIKIHDNGWTREILDLNLAEATQEQVFEISKLVETHSAVVIKNQKLTPDDQVRFMQLMGKVEDYSNYFELPYPDDANIVPNPRRKNPGDEHKILGSSLSERKIFRVGGAAEEGVLGLFGHKETLDWHCNRPWDKQRQPVIWLYAAEGSVGSRTSWINSALVWQELPEDMKNYLRPLQVINGHMENTYTVHNAGWKNISTTGSMIRYDAPQKVVYTNRRGVTSLDFPFLQVHHVMHLPIKESEELKAELTAIMTQEKYIYHHDWQDGDVTISDQYMGLHKRWAFEHMDKRVLHRIAGNYDNTPL